MSEVSELIPTPSGGVDEVGTSGAPGASGGTATPPQIRPILPTLPPRPSKTAAAPSNPGPAADSGPDSAAAQTSIASPSGPATERPVAAPKLLTAPPLVAPPLVAPPTGAPVLAVPTMPTGPAAPSTTGAALPPPSTAPVLADLPAPVPPTGLGSDHLPVEGSVVPSLPTLGLAPATPGLSAMRLNLEPIEDVAARAAANAEHEHQAELAAHAANADNAESAENSAPDTPASSFTNGSALSMLSSAPGTAPDPAATAAPAGPTGPIVPTLASNRPAATTAVEGDLDEAAIEASVEDALAAAAAKSGDPHLLAAAAHFAAQKQAAALPPVRTRKGSKQKSRRGRFVFLALVLLAGSGAAYVFRDSPIMQKARGVGYDPQALPGTVYERPAPGTMSFEDVKLAVAKESSGELVSTQIRTDVTINPADGNSRFDMKRSHHPIVDGVAASDPETTTAGQVILLDSTRYTRMADEAPGVWQSTARTTSGRTKWATIYMYQDIVDESLRRVRPVSTETRVEGTESLTTYTWEIPRGEFYESAPQLWALMSELEGVADPESIVTVVLTVDTSGVVHLLDVALDLTSVIEHTLSTLDEGVGVYYRLRWELRSMSDESYVPPVPDGATPPAADAAAAEPAAGDPAAAQPAAAQPAAAQPAADPAAALPAQGDPAAVPETVPATVPAAPAGG